MLGGGGLISFYLNCLGFEILIILGRLVVVMGCVIFKCSPSWFARAGLISPYCGLGSRPPTPGGLFSTTTSIHTKKRKMCFIERILIYYFMIYYFFLVIRMTCYTRPLHELWPTIFNADWLDLANSKFQLENSVECVGGGGGSIEQFEKKQSESGGYSGHWEAMGRNQSRVTRQIVNIVILTFYALFLSLIKCII